MNLGLWPIRIVPTRRGRFACLACGLVVVGTIAAAAHAAVERGRRREPEDVQGPDPYPLSLVRKAT